jgi:uncharacterized heparinase superfamily protein
MFDTTLLLARSIRHTKPTQLMARTTLRLKRRAHQLTRGLTASTLSCAAGHPLALADQLPLAVFPARTRLVDQVDGTTHVSLANRPWRLRTPMNWHPAELDALQRFHLHYMEYLEAVEDAEFGAVVADWIAQNPPYRREYWCDSWSAYTLSIRATVWMQEYARRRPRLTASLRSIMEASIAAQLTFLERNLERDIGGNHLLKNIKALLWAGRFFAGPAAAKWRTTGERLLAVELEQQILGDGFHFELSPAYHIQTFADLIECRQLLAPGALSDRLTVVLARMAQVVADTTHPDGYPSLFNDGGLHMSYPPSVVLSAFSSATGQTVAPRSYFAFDQAGYFGMRHGTDLLIADSGRVGPDHLPAHAHGDILSFEWSLSGHRVIVDAGVCEYNAGKWRNYARSTRAHNTVTVGDADQCEFWKAFRVGRRANVTVHRHASGAGLTLDGSHDGFARLAGAPVHRRRLQATGGRVDVRDAVTGGAGQPVVARLLLHPAFDVHKSIDGFEISNKKISVGLTTPHKVLVDHAWWCPDFNVRIPTRQLVIRYGAAPCDGGFQLRHRRSL